MKHRAQAAYTPIETVASLQKTEHDTAGNVMRLSRRPRLITAFIALFSVLFMQLAVAAYACPGLQPAPVSGMADMHMDSASSADMPGCDGMVDLEQPSLCHAYSQVGKQSLDKPPVPDVPPAVPVMLVSVISHIDFTFDPISRHAEAAWLMRSSSPPISVRHCCFRI